MAKEYSTQQIKDMIVAECRKQGIDPTIPLAIAQHESGFNPSAHNKANKDGTSDRGVFQLNSKYFKLKDPFDPAENIKRGVSHIKALTKTFGSDIDSLLAAYNAGAGAVQSGRIPASTRNRYVPSVKRILAQTATINNNKNGGNSNNMSSNTPQGNNTSFDVNALLQRLNVNPTYVTAAQLQQIYDQINKSTQLTKDEKTQVLNSIQSEMDKQKDLLEEAIQIQNRGLITQPVFDEQGRPVYDKEGNIVTETISPYEYQRIANQRATQGIQNLYNTQEAAQQAADNAYANQLATQRNNLQTAYEDAIQRQQQAVNDLRQQYLTAGYQPNTDAYLGLGDRMAANTLAFAYNMSPQQAAQAAQNARVIGNQIEQQNLLKFRRNLEQQMGMPYEQAIQVLQAQQQAVNAATEPYLTGMSDLAKEAATQQGGITKQNLMNLRDIAQERADEYTAQGDRARALAEATIDNISNINRDYMNNRAYLARAGAGLAAEYDRLIQQGDLQKADALLRSTIANQQAGISADNRNAMIGASMYNNALNNMVDMNIANQRINQDIQNEQWDRAYKLQQLQQQQARNEALNKYNAVTSGFYGGGINTPQGMAVVRSISPELADELQTMGSTGAPNTANPTASGSTYQQWLSEVRRQGLGY